MQKWKEKHPPSLIIEIHFRCIRGSVDSVQHVSEILKVFVLVVSGCLQS